MTRFLRATLLAAASTFVALTASADVPAAQAYVESKHGEIKKLVDANAPQAAVTAVIDGMVDYNEIAQRSLGKPCPTAIPNCTNHWDELNADQKKEVTDLFKQLVERKYRDNAYKMKDYEVTIKSGKDLGDNIVKVRTEAHNKTKPREPDVIVDYVVRCAPCKLVDLGFEGSILTKNYYDQSHKILTTAGQGYPHLVTKLREKANKK